jgi:hypothetical protein
MVEFTENSRHCGQTLFIIYRTDVERAPNAAVAMNFVSWATFGCAIAEDIVGMREEGNREAARSVACGRVSGGSSSNQGGMG